MGSARVMAVAVLVFLAALAMHTSTVKATDCSSVASTIFSCSSFLKDPNPTPPPGSSCCNSARFLLTLGDVKSLCQCLSPFTSGFLRSKAQQISSLCNLPDFSAIVPCVAPSSGVVPDSLLPPLPLPPIFPLPPILPLPPVLPLPPIFPLPPLIPLTREVPTPPPTKV